MRQASGPLQRFYGNRDLPKRARTVGVLPVFSLNEDD
jgi:hypothetical protein